MILGLGTRLGATAILGTMSVAVYHAIATSGFNIYLLELLALYFSSAFSIILLGPGAFSADYLILEVFKLKIKVPDLSISPILFNSDSFSKSEISKTINKKKLFAFPFSSFLSS